MYFILDKMREYFLQGIVFSIDGDSIDLAESSFVDVLLVFPSLAEVHVNA